MAGYSIEFRQQAWKDPDAMPERDARRVLSRIERLANDLAGDVKNCGISRPAIACALVIGGYYLTSTAMERSSIVFAIGVMPMIDEETRCPRLIYIPKC